MILFTCNLISNPQASFIVNAYVHGVRSRILQETVNCKIRRKLNERRLSNAGCNMQRRVSMKRSDSVLRRSQSEVKLTTIAENRQADDHCGINNDPSLQNGKSGREPETKRRPSLFRNNTIATFNMDTLEEVNELNTSPTQLSPYRRGTRVSFLFTEREAAILENCDIKDNGNITYV